MRIRTIKPEFFTHELLFESERETGLPIRVAFAGLWCAADREGRFRWQPRRLKIAILPYDDLDFSRVLDACLTRGLIVKYRVDDAWFGWIPSFLRHQVVNNRESESVFPDVSQGVDIEDNRRVPHACLTRAPREDHAACAGSRGREGKGREEERKGMEGVIARARDVDSVNGSEISPEESKTKGYHPDTRFILHRLNQLTGKNFRECDSSLFPISARLREPGVDKNAVVTMLERMAAIWKGTDMAEYLRPATLFNKTKFESYYAARNQPFTRRHNTHSALGADEFSVAGRDQRIAEYAELDRLEADKLAAGELDDPWLVYGPKPGQVGDMAQKGAPNGRARSEGAANGDMGRIPSPPDGPL